MHSLVRQTVQIVALRNEKGSYNAVTVELYGKPIVALRNEKGSYNPERFVKTAL